MSTQYDTGETQSQYWEQIAADTLVEETLLSPQIDGAYEQTVLHEGQALAALGLPSVAINAGDAHIPGYTSGASSP